MDTPSSPPLSPPSGHYYLLDDETLDSLLSGPPPDCHAVDRDWASQSASPVSVDAHTFNPDGVEMSTLDSTHTGTGVRHTDAEQSSPEDSQLRNSILVSRNEQPRRSTLDPRNNLHALVLDPMQVPTVESTLASQQQQQQSKKRKATSIDNVECQQQVEESADQNHHDDSIMENNVEQQQEDEEPTQALQQVQLTEPKRKSKPELQKVPFKHKDGSIRLNIDQYMYATECPQDNTIDFISLVTCACTGHKYYCGLEELFLFPSADSKAFSLAFSMEPIQTLRKLGIRISRVANEHTDDTNIKRDMAIVFRVNMKEDDGTLCPLVEVKSASLTIQSNSKYVSPPKIRSIVVVRPLPDPTTDSMVQIVVSAHHLRQGETRRLRFAVAQLSNKSWIIKKDIDVDKKFIFDRCQTLVKIEAEYFYGNTRLYTYYSDKPGLYENTCLDLPTLFQTEKKSQENIGQKLALVMKSGKSELGYKSVLKTIRAGKSKLILISNNCPPLRRSEIEYYAMLSKTNVHLFNGNNIDLGTGCGKKFRVSVMSVTNEGDSDILTAFAK
eukprot:gene13677-16106_t